MPVATTTQAGREVLTPEAEKLLNDRERRRQDAQRAAAARADTPTPLGATKPAFETESLPDPPAAPAPKVEKAARTFSISTEIAYRGRVLTVSASDMTIDQFCDLMDARGYASPAPLLLGAPVATADDLPDGYKLCRKHNAPMKPRQKQGDTWNSHNVGTTDNPCWCKGYRGPDSPGYEVD